MRKFLSLFLILTFAFALASCGGGDNGGGDGGNDDPEYTEVTFWHAMGTENQAVIDRIIAAFNEVYPDIVVTHTALGDYVGLRDGVLKASSAGNFPVMAQTYPDHVASYLTSAGLVAELTDFIEDTELGLPDYVIDNLVDSYWDEGMKYDENGSIYSLPFNKSTEVMFVNATWFKMHAIDTTSAEPKLITLTEKQVGSEYKLFNGDVEFTGDTLYVSYGLNGENPSLTWEQIAEIGVYYKSTDEYAALDAAGKDVHCAFGADSEANLFITLAQQWGGTYTSSDPSNHFPFVNDTNTRAAISWYEQNFDNGLFGTVEKFSASYTSDAFKAKQIVIALGSSAGASYNDPKGDFEVAVLPYPQKAGAAEADKYVIQQGTNVTLFNCLDPEVTEAGWKFMSFLLSPVAAYEWTAGTSYFPILESFNMTNSEIDTRFASAPADYVAEIKLYTAKYQDKLLGITRDAEGNILTEDGSDLKSLAKIVAWEQQKYFYTSEAFVGSSICRDQLKVLIDMVLYGDYDASAVGTDRDGFKVIGDGLAVYNK